MANKTVADHTADYLYYTLAIDTIFSVTGGGAMFLNDSFGNHDFLKAVYNHHEQASAMAAVGYAKARDGLGAVCVTTGCGCTNAITGLLDAWQDNVPVIFVSGQVKFRDTTYGTKQKIRQLGVQEANIIEIVKSITKYSVMLSDPKKIRYELEKASHIAQNGRSGPVWIDIPQDIQGAKVEWDELEPYSPEDKKISLDPKALANLQDELNKSARPIVLAGNGIRLASQREKFKEFIERVNVPAVFSYLSIDLLPSNHELNIGRLGTKGDRAGNFAIQNADLVLVLGSRLSIPLTGFEYKLFAREAKIIVIDIDPVEHSKDTVRIDSFIQGDLREFFEVERLEFDHADPKWLRKCQVWKKKWPVYDKKYAQEEKVNMYEFVDALREFSPDDAHFVSDAGSAYYVSSQAIQLSETQRYHTSGAQADMGFTLPAAIGVSMAKKEAAVIAITGDGSLQMNLQELQLLAHHKPNIKLVVWNNGGYLSIKTTQRKFFSDRFAGTGTNSGLSFPSTKKIADAYGIPYHCISTPSRLRAELRGILDASGPVLIEVICPEFQEVIPNVSALKREDGSMVSKPLEDMYPFLDRKVFSDNMIVKPLDE
ncbi:thiamine pyrophosphate-binding protein [Litorivivens sp.]|uniref:thiamine pyrophosphate-binding protein n=1 Tax=Litorivivens sp. TaxID=2020868 RepID=UPI003567CE4D